MKTGKRRSVLVFTMLLVCCMVMAAGCGAGKTDTNAGDAQSSFINLPSDIADGDLSEEAVAAFNEAFTSTVTDESGITSSTEISCFFTSFYEDPKDIDLPELLRYCPLAVVIEDEEEYQKVRAAADIELPEKLDDSPTPVKRYSRADVDALLSKYAGITTADLSGVANGDTPLVYVEELDAYYNFTSDFGPGSFTAVSGTKEGNLYTLKDEQGRTLKAEITDETESGLKILSFTKN